MSFPLRKTVSGRLHVLVLEFTLQLVLFCIVFVFFVLQIVVFFIVIEIKLPKLS